MSSYDFDKLDIDDSVRYRVYDVVNDCLLKDDCRLIATIPAGLPLSDNQVRKWFGIEEGDINWRRAHLPNSKFNRFVFDKCIVPNNPSFYRVEVLSDE